VAGLSPYQPAQTLPFLKMPCNNTYTYLPTLVSYTHIIYT